MYKIMVIVLSSDLVIFDCGHHRTMKKCCKRFHAGLDSIINVYVAGNLLHSFTHIACSCLVFIEQVEQSPDSTLLIIVSEPNFDCHIICNGLMMNYRKHMFA